MITFTGLTNGRCLELHQNLITGSLDQNFTLNPSVHEMEMFPARELDVLLAQGEIQPGHNQE